MTIAIPQLPAGWTFVDKHYVRPTVGTEFDMARLNRLCDGQFNFCFGFTLNTDIPNLPEAVVEALVRVRFSAPLIAASIEPLAGSPDNFQWVYAPMKSKDDALAWARATLIVHETTSTDEQVINSITDIRLPYHIGDRREQVFACHLILRPNGEHALFMHGSHAVLDARPTMHTLRHLFHVIVHHDDEPCLDQLPYGGEVASLPVDIIQLLGKDLLEAAKTSGIRLPEQLNKNLPSIGLAPQRNDITAPALRACVGATINTDKLRSVLSALKAIGFSFTLLCDAAIALTTIKRNCNLDADWQYIHDNTIIALQRYFPSGYSEERHIASSMAYVPLVLSPQSINMDSPLCDQLVEVMSALRKEYTDYFSQPALPFANIVARTELRSLPLNPHRPFFTNIGVIDKFVPSMWVGGNNDKLHLELGELKFGHRIINMRCPVMHAWTFRDVFHLQIQFLDVYDMEYLQSLLDEIITTMLGIVN
ncbi:uncharacterized protein PHACADRAFT_198396 [Phanerochaete carnosa HHB-10118-sp]|uniref:Condensation domain-containing protein n=1 Tax=Phanerochaete carnosa (strain HHB-10118-sp) TaxID=650164 RepID=K5WPT7_PHACS|nr:uncharacterized protein PHACADRAFT_198396 [Phanerochaete carnosa HHB-10118-sp]EKM52332.1 hypothetical protein PHACADRAFT_198396 [Phanerochaete carnosa HHB-10118-sp]